MSRFAVIYEDPSYEDMYEEATDTDLDEFVPDINFDSIKEELE